jgi:hypothetical protein
MKLLNKSYELATGREPSLDMGAVPHLGAAILKNFLRLVSLFTPAEVPSYA